MKVERETVCVSWKRWSKEKTNTGTIAIVPAARIGPQSTPFSVLNPVMATGSVTAARPVRYKANGNLFHEVMRQSKKAATSPGKTSGNAIRKNIEDTPTPSTLADS